MKVMTAIETTIAGLRSKVGPARILAVLEPRSATMKLGVMKDSLAGSLDDAHATVREFLQSVRAKPFSHLGNLHIGQA